MSWSETIRGIREGYIKDVQKYIDDVMPELTEKKIKDIKKNTSDFISKIYSSSYKRYLFDEQIFAKEVIENLLITPEANKYLKEIGKPIAKDLSNSLTDEQIKDNIAQLLSSSLHAFNDHLYDLNLSTTNSRRPRSGRTFELIMEILIEKIYNYGLDTKKKVGRNEWTENNLNKIDFLIPNLTSFKKNKHKTVLIVTKTSLKERWEQIVSELDNKKLNQIFLCTLDRNLNDGLIKNIVKNNIKLVLLNSQKQKFQKFKNVISFEFFFNNFIPNIIL